LIVSIEAEVFEQHAIEAGLLWPLRDAAARDAAYHLAGLTELDLRLEAHLDGLRLSGDAGWAFCEAALDEGEAGEVFAAALLAVERGDLRGVARVLDVAGGTPALARGIVAALGWASFDDVRRILPGLLDGRCPPALHYLGIAAAAVHRQDPGVALGYALGSGDLRLRSRALRAVGELGRADLLPEVRRELRAADEPARFAAAFSAALLGERAAGDALWELADGDGPFALRACDLAARVTEPASAEASLRSLARSPARVATALRGAAALGDPALVPWILDQMTNPDRARAAGAALAAITGVDLAGAKMASKRPVGFVAGPTEDPADDDVAMDPDDGLAWPAPEVVRRWWSAEAGRFKRGVRTMLGQPITTPWLEQVLRQARQPARAAAALELSLGAPGRRPFEVRAPGFRQQRDLAGR
jgi:uncharacterized protein (TIGR02270 family)